MWKLAVLASVLGVVVYWVRYSPLSATEHRVDRGTIVVEVMGTGTLEARVQSIISPKIAGRIESIAVDQGDHVAANQTLFHLDDAELKQQVAIAEASIASAEAAIDRLTADQSQAVAVLEQAKRNHERAEQLMTRNATTAEEGERAAEALHVAEAGVARAAAAILEGRRQLVAAEKTLAYRQALLADAEIRAPFAGLIVKRHRDPGDVVMPGSPTLTLVSLDEIWVSAWVDETEMEKVRVGQPAKVVFRSVPDRQFEGEVARLGRETDRETREFVVDVRVLTLPENWAVGQRAEVYMETQRKDSVLKIPASLIRRRSDETGVYRRRGDFAEWCPLTLGLRSREDVEVIRGLEPGSSVLGNASGNPVDLDGRRIVVQ